MASPVLFDMEVLCLLSIIGLRSSPSHPLVILKVVVEESFCFVPSELLGSTWCIQNYSYCTRAERASELHDLVNYHHRVDGEDVHVPLGDISKVQG